MYTCILENRNGKVEVDYHSFTAFTLDKVDVTIPTNLNVVYGRNAGIKAHGNFFSFLLVPKTSCSKVRILNPFTHLVDLGVALFFVF